MIATAPVGAHQDHQAITNTNTNTNTNNTSTKSAASAGWSAALGTPHRLDVNTASPGLIAAVGKHAIVALRVRGGQACDRVWALKWPAPAWVTTTAWSRDGRVLAIGIVEGTRAMIELRRAEDGEVLDANQTAIECDHVPRILAWTRVGGGGEGEDAANVLAVVTGKANVVLYLDHGRQPHQVDLASAFSAQRIQDPLLLAVHWAHNTPHLHVVYQAPATGSSELGLAAIKLLSLAVLAARLREDQTRHDVATALAQLDAAVTSTTTAIQALSDEWKNHVGPYDGSSSLARTYAAIAMTGYVPPDFEDFAFHHLPNALVPVLETKMTDHITALETAVESTLPSALAAVRAATRRAIAASLSTGTSTSTSSPATVLAPLTALTRALTSALTVTSRAASIMRSTDMPAIRAVQAWIAYHIRARYWNSVDAGMYAYVEPRASECPAARVVMPALERLERGTLTVLPEWSAEVTSEAVGREVVPSVADAVGEVKGAWKAVEVMLSRQDAGASALGEAVVERAARVAGVQAGAATTQRGYAVTTVPSGAVVAAVACNQALAIQCLPPPDSPTITNPPALTVTLPSTLGASPTPIAWLVPRRSDRMPQLLVRTALGVAVVDIPDAESWSAGTAECQVVQDMHVPDLVAVAAGPVAWDVAAVVAAKARGGDQGVEVEMVAIADLV
ncbi:hypothetical protein AMAG_02525 [Allomyces macrogynus ATCC 38327]|uniref:Anaphase-promoting complex subunit 4 n=1 Tax=Allomyces macrogynus (strain ATCC 38327) TaxID=578462 RepID=A0A0L0S2W0_ALLM3|nr:hypothetical protein AMAG_02525 [Allomyces macrogynus ATCC 38327]|eukprot:KNE56745.1 hypothetical protein AMAG_02525 [Allomyces macrogynus ATCC 38327]